MSAPKVLLISYVWPEPHASAAGKRQLDWIRFFRAEYGAEVHVASQARSIAPEQQLTRLGVRTHLIAANSSDFDTWIAELRPRWVVFDRFVTEEQFGWRVEQACPEAVRILDTQDLHSLRRARAEWIRQNPEAFVAPTGLAECEKLLLSEEDFLREAASILRSDLTLVISAFEHKLLEHELGLPGELLCTVPFAYSLPASCARSVSERAGYVFIGNFRHEPNADAVRMLARIWPEIRKRRSDATIRIYGAYPSRDAMALHSPRDGFYLEGPAPEAHTVLASARLLLAPLRFGAGLKGKISDAWAVGTPVVTTSIGSEGFFARKAMAFPEMVADALEDFIGCALTADQPDRWSAYSNSSIKHFNQTLQEMMVFRSLRKRLDILERNLAASRRRRWLKRLLAREQYRSTEFFSRWIEAKNKQAVQ